tara:strand:+ start:16060 stop:17553 length:1494 start_codon:yes stop_codon:yes gene_type:complete
MKDSKKIMIPILKNSIVITTLFIASLFQINCSSSTSEEVTNNPPENPTPPITITNDIDFWLTKGDQSVTLNKQVGVLGFSTTYNTLPNIEVNETQTYQTVDGFGYTLTGGSAEVINSLSASKKQVLLQELFGISETSISINYLRISVGASDLNSIPFTYNDVNSGETDLDLSEFSLAPDQENVIALLKEILSINPEIKILATPWSAPVWMKDNDSFIGGSLQTQYYEVYAQYLVKYIKAMKAEGIAIDALTPQNEPLHDGNNPSMVMTAVQQTNFIKNNLGPALQAENLATKIIAYDHNCDNPQYPITILNDEVANTFVDGSAFHLYAGDISALSTVHNAFPDKNLYFTEQYTPSTGSFSGDLKWHLKNVIIGSMRNWSKNALEWNLANDSSFGPHTPGGCTTCKGAITINSNDSFTRNVGYYIIAHASKFVPTGAVRINSNINGSLHNVAFKRPDGKKVLIVLNDSAINTSFNIKYNDKWATTSLDAGAVGTFIWE